MEHFRVAVVGSGFAGTILARVLNRSGVDVVLLERHTHPRFAIGESSTPLAAICLERLARRYGLEDLSWLAAYGRWMEMMPENRRGLKRGFTFYGHRRGEEFAGDPANTGRLLVAASPEDAVADSHWLRSDVDDSLVRRAVDEGVDFRDRVEVQGLERDAAGLWTVTGQAPGGPFELTADVMVDATGAGGLLSRLLAVPSALDRVDLDTALVFSHFTGVEPFVELEVGPYPDERAAVHHLIEEGWIYALPFDHGVVSAGILLSRPAFQSLLESGLEEPEAIWETVLARYPSLERQFSNARPVRSVDLLPRVQRRMDRAAGRGWAMLPHSYGFLDPMFSTGIAWSLIAVERLAGILTPDGDRVRPSSAIHSGLQRYGEQLRAEAEQLGRLIDGAYSAKSDFSLFAAQSFLYFAVVSFMEVDQRLRPEGRDGVAPAWQGFVGAGDARLESAFADSLRQLAAIGRDDRGQASAGDRDTFVQWIRETVAPWNVGGFGDPERRNLYPVDLDLLVDRAALLGMTRDEMRSNLPLLRGVGAPVPSPI